jgi:hypothetical protein
MKKQRRVQASKRQRAIENGNPAIRDAFIELRKGSRTSPHKNRARDRKVTGWDWED